MHDDPGGSTLFCDLRLTPIDGLPGNITLGLTSSGAPGDYYVRLAVTDRAGATYHDQWRITAIKL